MTQTAHERFRPRGQCLGMPAFAVDSRIVDPGTLEELAQGEAGELITGAPQVMPGYFFMRGRAARAGALRDRRIIGTPAPSGGADGAVSPTRQFGAGAVGPARRWAAAPGDGPRGLGHDTTGGMK